ncbi:MAG: hypothetical protein EXS60_00455 [Candidatus Pacebacteria bacterium]|nr:hypothetical protein [Candidatus Paceibacterota bacterium]
MKKQIISGFFIAHGVIFGFSAGVAEAATLPPGNPFYFVQDGVRSLRKALTFSPVSRALLELRLVSERRADIKEILAAGKDNQIVFTALAAYDDEVDSLATYAKSIGDDQVLTGVAELFMSHTKFFNTALVNENVATSVGVRASVIASRDNLTRLVTEAFGQNGHGAFRNRAQAFVAADTDAYRELYALDALTGLSRAVASPDMKRELALFKEGMATVLVGKLKKGSVTAEKIVSLPGDPIMRFYSIAAMRDRAGDIETKNTLTLASQNVLQAAAESRFMTAHEARAAIAYASAVTGMHGVKSDQGDYFIQQANRFMSEGSYDLAFQHGVLAAGAATDALLLNTLSAQELRDELALVKRQYDAVRVKPAFIDKRIAAVADATGRVPVRETLTAIREIKLILALLGN